VTLALKTKGPLTEGHEYIQGCNCSICSRVRPPLFPSFFFISPDQLTDTSSQNGTILIYPLATQVSIHASTPTTPYTFGRALQSHEFCPICGVSIYIRKLSVSPEHFAKWITDGRDQKEWEKQMPVNLRNFEGAGWERMKIPVANNKVIEPKYEV
jgi:hypothetical protein